jgi:hypothetical protein
MFDDKYAPIRSSEDLVRTAYQHKKEVIVIPYRGYNISVEISTWDGRQHDLDQIRIMKNFKDVTNEFVQLADDQAIRPYGSNVGHIIKIIDNHYAKGPTTND